MQDDEPGATGGGAGFSRLLIAVAVILILAPVALFPVFPSQDGPPHVNAAIVLERLASRERPESDFFFARPVDLTNTAVTGVLQALLKVLPADQVERGYIALYLLAFAAVALACTAGARRGRLVGVLLLLTLAYSHMLHMGSYNLTLAYLGLLAVLTLCHGYLSGHRPWKLAALGAALVATYFLHVQVALLAGLCVGVASLWRLAMGLGDRGRGPILPALRDAAWLAACTAPLAAFILAFSLKNAQALGAVTRIHHIGPAGKALQLALLSGVASYSVFGLLLAACLFLLLCLLTGLAIARAVRRGPSGADMLGACALVLGLVYLAIPNGLGEALNVEERTMVPFLMALICWLAAAGGRLVASRGLALAVLVLLALQTIDRVAAFRAVNIQAADALALRPALPQGGAVVFVDLDIAARLPVIRDLAHPFAPALRFSPFAGFGGAIVGDRRVAWVNNYEGEWARPYFALKQRPWLAATLGPENPGVLAGEVGPPAFADLTARLQGAPLPIDDLILWSADPRTRASPSGRTVAAAVMARYDRIAVSPKGFATLWRLKSARRLPQPRASAG